MTIKITPAIQAALEALAAADHAVKTYPRIPSDNRKSRGGRFLPSYAELCRFEAGRKIAMHTLCRLLNPEDYKS